MDGKIDLVWGEAAEEEDEPIDDEEDLFACDDCGYYPIRESDTSCAGCGAQFVDEDEPVAQPSRGPSGGGPPSRGPSGGGPPSRGPGGGPPSRGPSGGPPSRGPGGPPKRKGPPR